MSASLPLTLLRGLGLAFFAGLSLGMFAYVMTAPLNHNEHMYVSAAVLLKSAAIHSDFSYLQTPYLAWLYAHFFETTGVSHLLGWARALTFALGWVAAAFVYRLGRIGSGARIGGMLAVAFVCSSHNVRHAVNEASNYVLPLTLLMLATSVFVGSEVPGSTPCRFRSGRFRLPVVCLLLGLAIGAKSYFAVFAISFAILAALEAVAHEQGSALADVGRLTLGLALGTAPLLVVTLRDPGAFVFDNFTYHFHNAALVSGRAKIPYALEALFYRNLPLVLALGVAVYSHHRSSNGNTAPGDGIQPEARQRVRRLVGLLVPTALVVSLIPSPPHSQYFSVVVPFLAIAAVTVGGGFAHANRDAVAIACRRGAIGLAALSFILGSPSTLGQLPALWKPATWTGASVHRAGQAMRAAIEDAGVSGPVATLAPIYALEGGLPIYPELATGRFVFRMAHRLTEGERAARGIVSPAGLSALLDSRPPSAVLTCEPLELDSAFLRYAVERDFDVAETPVCGGTLFLSSSN